MTGTIVREQEKAIQALCAKIVSENGRGTGFFVSSYQIVTCAHVVGTPGSVVSVELQDQKYSAEVIESTDTDYPDIAILKLLGNAALPESSGLPLFDDCRPDDSCYSFGFSDQNESDPVTFQVEGISGSHSSYIKFDQGQIRPGMSGSPVFNLRTMSVCGVIQETRDRSSALGGWALPISEVFSRFPSIWALPKPRGWTLSPFHYYAHTFLSQYEDHTLSSTQAPIVRPIFHSDLSTLYVSPGCVNDRGHKKGPVDSALMDWIDDDKSKYLVLLGEYGSGKTAACLRFCHSLLRLDSPLLPLFISLGDIANASNSTDALISILRGQYRIPLTNASDIIETFDRYAVLLILDGFDEVAGSLESALLREKLRALSTILLPSQKALITCRTTLFPTKQDLDYVFPIQAEDVRFLDDFLSKSHFDTLFITDYGEREIRTYIETANPRSHQRILNTIMGRYELLDLAGRPLLLSMITRTADSIASSNEANKVTTAVIYEKFVSWWLKQESSKSTLTVDRKTRTLESLANRLQGHNISHISREEFSEFLANKAIGAPTPIEAIEHDFVNASFLTRTIDGHFGFSHRSFMEFFAAGAILRCFSSKAESSALGEHPLGGGVLRFVIERIATSMQADKITDMLLDWIEKPATAEFENYLFANTATILTWLGFSFEDMDLQGVNFQQADLRNGSFKGSDLRSSCFDNANLAHVDFTRADLEGATFKNAFLRGTIFRKANLTGTNFWNLRIVGGPESLWSASFYGPGLEIAVGTGSGHLLTYVRSESTWDERLRLLLTKTGILHMASDSRGEFIAITDRDTNVQIFRLEDLIDGSVVPLRTFSGGHDNIRWVEFSPCGSKLATASRDNRVRIWSVRDHLTVKDIAVHQGPVMQASWSNDGARIASIGYDGNVIYTTIEEEKGIVLRSRKDKQSHAGIGRSIAFNPASDHLASGGEDGMVKIWDLSRPYRPKWVENVEIGAGVFALNWRHPDLIVAGTDNGNIVFLKRRDGRVESKKEICAHTDIVRSIDLRKEEQTCTMISASWDGMVKLWRIRDDMSFEEEHVRPSFCESDQPQQEFTELFEDAAMEKIVGLPQHLNNCLLGKI